jgi:hypothetical protein
MVAADGDPLCSKCKELVRDFIRNLLGKFYEMVGKCGCMYMFA